MSVVWAARLFATVIAGGSLVGFTYAPAPEVKIAQEVGAAGPVAMVQLDHWPIGAVQVSVCGNNSRRGSQDCDLRGAGAVSISGAGSAAVKLPPLTPPIGCPCVIRVATLKETLVVTTPVVAPGLPILPREITVPETILTPDALTPPMVTDGSFTATLPPGSGYWVAVFVGSVAAALVATRIRGTPDGADDGDMDGS